MKFSRRQSVLNTSKLRAIKYNGWTFATLSYHRIRKIQSSIKTKTIFQQTVNNGLDVEMQQSFSKQVADVIITQGFIARAQNGDTVLLGRGGSDVSATCLASKLGATRVEIWTDVPGLFTANPRKIPNARLLKTLDYNEAQELAASEQSSSPQSDRASTEKVIFPFISAGPITRT